LVVNRLSTKSPEFNNADYIFDNENIIAELKILEVDSLSEREIDTKIRKIFSKWMQSGELIVYGSLKNVPSADLPEKLQWELQRVYSEPMRRVIKKANKQIRDTKKHFGVPAAKGLVIIVNNGNHRLDPENFAFAAHQLLKASYLNINGATVVTVNMTAKKPGIPTDYKLWVDYERAEGDLIDREFLNKLRSEWVKLYSELAGDAMPLLHEPLSEFCSLKYEKHV
jgi:hypothetical protein